jgi:hypothetical protein
VGELGRGSQDRTGVVWILVSIVTRGGRKESSNLVNQLTKFDIDAMRF